MRIDSIYDHRGALDILNSTRPHILSEVRAALAEISHTDCFAKICQEKKSPKYGKMLYDPGMINASMRSSLESMGWTVAPKSIFSCGDGDSLETRSNTGDFLRDRVQLEVQFGKYAFVCADLFYKLFHNVKRGHIDIGVEIMPMSELQHKMSSGVPSFETEVVKLRSLGGEDPAAPILMVGISD